MQMKNAPRGRDTVIKASLGHGMRKAGLSEPISLLFYTRLPHHVANSLLCWEIISTACSVGAVEKGITFL